MQQNEEDLLFTIVCLAFSYNIVSQCSKAAMKGYEELKAEKPDAMRPVFVIGSEVPIPGGATEAEDTLAVTKPEAFRDTVSTYQRVWTEEGVGEGMKDVIAVVVQPGVEFGDKQEIGRAHV